MKKKKVTNTKKLPPLTVEMLREEMFKNKLLLILFSISFLINIGLGAYTIYLISDIDTSTEIVDMETEEGNNNYIGGDNNGAITNN